MANHSYGIQIRHGWEIDWDRLWSLCEVAIVFMALVIVWSHVWSHEWFFPRSAVKPRETVRRKPPWGYQRNSRSFFLTLRGIAQSRTMSGLVNIANGIFLVFPHLYFLASISKSMNILRTLRDMHWMAEHIKGFEKDSNQRPRTHGDWYRSTLFYSKID